MRKRIWTYGWADLGYVVEVDYVCEHCNTIVLDRAKGCQYCKGKTEQREAKKEADTWEGKWKARLAPKTRGGLYDV